MIEQDHGRGRAGGARPATAPIAIRQRPVVISPEQEFLPPSHRLLRLAGDFAAEVKPLLEPVVELGASEPTGVPQSRARAMGDNPRLEGRSWLGAPGHLVGLVSA